MARKDKFYGNDIGLSDPSDTFKAVVPHDSNKIDLPKWLYVSVAGDLSFKDQAGTTITIPVDKGYHPLRPTIIRATGTTATGIVAAY